MTSFGVRLTSVLLTSTFYRMRESEAQFLHILCLWIGRCWNKGRQQQINDNRYLKINVLRDLVPRSLINRRTNFSPKRATTQKILLAWRCKKQASPEHWCSTYHITSHDRDCKFQKISRKSLSSKSPLISDIKIQKCGKAENRVKLKLNSVALVRTRTIPTERPPPVGEVSANFCG